MSYMRVSIGSGDIVFFKQKTAYEMRISDWSSDVCSSDLLGNRAALQTDLLLLDPGAPDVAERLVRAVEAGLDRVLEAGRRRRADLRHACDCHGTAPFD